MHISGMSGNEIYCLGLKGYSPGELTVGNSVVSMGVMGGLSSFARTMAGGEVTAITEQIADGRHRAIKRLEEEARKHQASGITGVTAELKTVAGYTEFLAQGTAVHTEQSVPFFSTAASGVQMYCHLDAGYQPRHFALGNVAYALGLSRGITGSLRSIAQGEVKEFSQMYNEIRHHALSRLRAEAAASGANAVVDVNVKIMPFAPGVVEFLVTGTASHHPEISPGKVRPEEVVTSSLSGEELWNLASMGLVPKQLVMATSIYSLGLTAGIGSMFKAMSKGELPEVTKLVYSARENAMEMVRAEAKGLGAQHVIGNKLTIRELQSGMLEVFAVGTAVELMGDRKMRPESESLIPQAVIVDKGALELSSTGGESERPTGTPTSSQRANLAGCCVSLAIVVMMIVVGIIAAIAKHH